MSLGSLFAALDPYARVITAVVPFVIALVLRLAFGRRRMTDVLLTLATSWFVVNIVIAPFALEMRQGLHEMLKR